MVQTQAENIHPLDQELFRWNERDAYRVRDLLNGGCLIVGRAGSGKTSSSGRLLMQSIVDNPNSALLILAAKPEDADDVQAIFRKAGRLKDLIVFDAEGANRCNFFGCLKRPRDVVTFISTLSEVMERGGKGGEGSQFYDQQRDRTIYNAVAALQAAKEPLTAANIHKFLMTAAASRGGNEKAGMAGESTIRRYWREVLRQKRRRWKNTTTASAWIFGFLSGRC